MSRWVHATAVVQVGDNEQKVRGLSHRERSQFAEASRKIAGGTMGKHELPEFVAKLGCVGISDEDLAEMPAKLMDECVTRIMELTGLKDAKPDTNEDPEKKGS